MLKNINGINWQTPGSWWKKNVWQVIKVALKIASLIVKLVDIFNR